MPHALEGPVRPHLAEGKRKGLVCALVRERRDVAVESDEADRLSARSLDAQDSHLRHLVHAGDVEEFVGGRAHSGNTCRTDFRPSTSASTSPVVLYAANDALAVATRPSRAMRGCAQ